MFRWILDTRTLWSGDFPTQAEPYLCLLKSQEKEAVLRYYHAKDRALSLGSFLCKYLAISRVTGLPWSSIKLSRDAQHKPCYNPSSPNTPILQFNVSHQAGIVALVASPGDARRVGIDITCIHERDEYKEIDAKGFDEWVAVYAEVFSDREVQDMTYHLPSLHLPDGRVISADDLGETQRCCKRNQSFAIKLHGDEEVTISSNEIIEAKLRRFYTFWALKEAYVKMTGEALLADWLRELEFRNVRAPTPTDLVTEENPGQWGETIKDVQVWYKGRQVENVVLEVQAFEQDYIIATAVSMSSANPHMEKGEERKVGELEGVLPPFRSLNLQRELPEAGQE